MADLKRTGLNNRKRTISVHVASLAEADILATAITAALPERVLIQDVYVNTLTASGTGSASITVKIGTTNLAVNKAVTAVGVTRTAANVYAATGGDVSVVAGSTAPANGAWVGEVLVEYIELDRTTDQYVG